MHTSHPIATVGACALALLFAAHSADAQSTLAHWNFDSGKAGLSLSALPAPDQTGNAYLIHGYDSVVGPSYSSDTATGTGLSCRADGAQDGYTLDSALNAWSPLSWTIEISVRMDAIDGWRTIIGRDGTSFPGALKSDFYFQNNGLDDRFRLDFATVDGARHLLDSTFAAVPGVWYHVALVGDGKSVAMYINSNDGAGYRLAGSTVLSDLPGANNALATNGANWTFGRGWYGEKHVDHIDGHIDDIRFTNGALEPASFLHAPAPAAVQSSLELARNGREVSLAWALPPGSIQRLSIYRHDRDDATGRTLVATLYPPAKMYLDQVPEAGSTYWYWAVATTLDGRDITLGPTRTLSGEIWAP